MSNFNPSAFPGGAITASGVDLTNDLFPFWDASGTTSARSRTITPAELRILTRSKTIAVFTPLLNQPPAANFATLDTRNSIAVLDFDDTTDEFAVFVGVIPEGTSLTNGIVARINWMTASATSGNVKWGVKFEKMNTNETTDSFDTATTGFTACNATSGFCSVTSITCTTIDSLVAGDFFRVSIYRDSADTTNDTVTGDAQFVALELQAA